VLDDEKKIHQTPKYDRKHPFYAPVLEKIKLNGRGSGKETLHIELSLENSGISYKPGDALGVCPVNMPELIKELLALTNLDSKTELKDPETDKITLYEALYSKYEISVITSDVMTKFAAINNNKDLHNIVNDHKLLKDYMAGNDIIDMLNDFPVSLSAEQLIGILRKLQPRMYSIASSLDMHPDEAHLLVCVIKYRKRERNRFGVCSCFLSSDMHDEKGIPVFVESNSYFALPADSSVPVIMIGPGTGVAPFRAFVEQRIQSDTRGKSWLFFGDRNFNTDFYYQNEWLRHVKDGYLTRMDIAFSRDTESKVYVQHKMQKHSKDIYSWIQEGAYIYVCGDMHNMANDVNNTLINIIEKEGNTSKEDAIEYINELQKTHRYQTDVY
jgi:sulfite reductase (NADPH) flavoprotein alpha-component